MRSACDKAALWVKFPGALRPDDLRHFGFDQLVHSAQLER